MLTWNNEFTVELTSMDICFTKVLKKNTTDGKIVIISLFYLAFSSSILIFFSIPWTLINRIARKMDCLLCIVKSCFCCSGQLIVMLFKNIYISISKYIFLYSYLLNVWDEYLLSGRKQITCYTLHLSRDMQFFFF